MTRDLHLQMPPEVLKFIEQDLTEEIMNCDACLNKAQETGDSLSHCEAHSHRVGFRMGAYQIFDILKNDLKWHGSVDCPSEIRMRMILHNKMLAERWHLPEKCPTTIEIKKEADEIINNLVGFHSMDTKELLLKVRTAVASYKEGERKAKNSCVKETIEQITQLKDALTDKAEGITDNDMCCWTNNEIIKMIDTAFEAVISQSKAGVLQSGGGTQVICKALSTSVPTEDASNRTPDKPTS